jgi:hypothetical protein
VAPIVPALAPAKALRSDASVPTIAALVEGATGGRECSDDGRATVQRGHDHGAAAGGNAVAAVITTTTTAPMVPPVSAPSGDNRAAVMEIPDADALPPGWGQWGN